MKKRAERERDGEPGAGDGRKERPEDRGPGGDAREPDVAWGPGLNFHGWMMTMILLAAVAGIAFAGFRLFGDTLGPADSSGTVEEREMLERQVENLGADLCVASMGAGGASEASVQIFHEKVHGPLHALADALAPEDRAAAADLLRKKFNVEEDIRRKAPPAELAISFGQLNESTMDALRLLSLPSPACPAPAQPPAPAPPQPGGAPPPAAPAP